MHKGKERRDLPTYLMGYSLQFVTVNTAWKTSVAAGVVVVDDAFA